MTYLQEDIDIIANSEYGSLLKGKKILITGATGLIGSLLTRSLLKIDCELYIIVRNVNKAKIIYEDSLEKINVIKGDITNNNWCEGIDTDIDYIFHCAAVTTSKVMISKPVETIKTAIDGTDILLKFAVLHHVKTFIYISSMEVYGSLDEECATENKLGYIDISQVRSDYPESKRMAENLCIAYSSEYGLDVRIARLAQTFGPGILPWEGRVFAQFAKSVIEGSNIVLHTKGLSEGNYCYSRDMILGLFTILFKGKSGEAYNIVNEKTHTTIADMAQLVAEKVADRKIKVIYDIPQSSNQFGYAADTHLKLSAQKLEKLGWKPEVGLVEMYERMIHDLALKNK